MDTLPPSLRAIANIVGIPAALAIAARWGGIRLYIKADPGEDDELTRMIGIDSARALGREYGGDRIEIPQAARWHLKLKYKIIREGLSQGISQARLAREHRYSERNIRIILRGGEGDEKQKGFEF